MFSPVVVAAVVRATLQLRRPSTFCTTCDPLGDP